MKKKIFLFCLVFSLSCNSFGITQRIFFIDSKNGNDLADGLSPGKSRKSPDHINSESFLPGDRILIRSGSAFTGQLRPHGSGTVDNPIIIDTYGNEGKVQFLSQKLVWCHPELFSGSHQ
jgi:hypothetical protein